MPDGGERDQLRAGELQFAIVPAGLGEPGVNTKPFASIREFFVSRSGYGLPQMAPLRLANLPPMKIIVPGATHARRRILEDYFALTQARIGRRLELDTMFGTVDLVTRTDWVTILPTALIAEEITQRRLVVNPLVPVLTLQVILAEPSRMDLPRAAAAFLGILHTETI